MMDFIAVQTLDGRHVLINREAIVTVGGPRASKEQPMLTGKATCLITLVDGSSSPSLRAAMPFGKSWIYRE